MNSLCYRLVFNCARDMMMVVAECAITSRGMVQSTLHVALLWPLVAVGQIMPDAGAPTNRQPLVTTAANGVPLVNIQTPTAAGVSRNAFNQFDVQGRGAILNNARQSTLTSLGGWVQSNPLLEQAATVIVNEVIASHPSLLHGPIEVAGQRAHVIIANPAGITCNGCGFINANHATFTTGIPHYSSSGNLERYLVRQGTVRFTGDGLNANSVDFTDVIARAVQVSAALRAQQLHVITGSNDVGAGELKITAAPNPNEPPTFAIDVAALGGMYASKIWLVSTEAGVGVRSAGTLGGGAHEIRITSAGRIELSGVIDSTGQLEMASAQPLVNRGLISGGDVVLQSTAIEHLGTGRIFGDHVMLNAATVRSEIEGAPSDDVPTAAPVIAARHRIDIGADQITQRDGALIYSDGDLAIGRTLDEHGHAVGHARLLENVSATIEARGHIDLAVDEVRNLNPHYRQQSNTKPTELITEVAGSGSPNRYAPSAPDVYVYLDESDHLHTPEGNHESWLRYQYQRSVTEDITTRSVPAQLLAGGNLRVRGAQLTNDKSRILAGQTLDVQVTAVNNIDATGQRITKDSGTVTSFWRDHHKGRDSTGMQQVAYDPPPRVETISLGVVSYREQTQPAASRLVEVGLGDGASIRSLNFAPSALTHGLYLTAPDARDYRIETDPRFTNYRQWLGSDYLLQQMALQPQQMLKRLGDGFYEQKLVREQVAQLTGRRFLPGYSNDEAQFQALMDNAVRFAQSYQLRPGVALSAEQMAALTSDIVWLIEQDVTLPNGAVTRALVPQLYARVRDGDLHPDGALLSGNQVKLSLTGDLANQGSIIGSEVVKLDATNVKQLGGTITGATVTVNASEDVHQFGGQLSAEQALTITAGRDITVATTTASATSAQDHRTHVDRIAKLAVRANDGHMVVAAANTLTLNGAVVQQGRPVTANSTLDTAKNSTAMGVRSTANNATARTSSNMSSETVEEPGSVLLSAGNDVRMDTVTEASGESVHWTSGNQRTELQRNEVVTRLDATGAVAVAAGRDIRSRGVQLKSSEGDIQLNAARDVSLGSAESHVTLDESHRHTQRGLFSSTTYSSHDSRQQTTQHGTLLSGERVSIRSGQDIAVSGSAIASNQGTTLIATRNLTMTAATNTRDETHRQQKDSSGLIGAGGFGVTIGSRHISTQTNTSTTTAASSTIGSTQGDVTINAGGAVTQTGSHVVAAQGSVVIAAQRFEVMQANNTDTTVTDTRFRQSGLTVAVANPIVAAVQTAHAMAEAASDTKDERLKALAAANSALAAKTAIDAVKVGQGTTIHGKPNQIATGTDAAGNPTSRDANSVDQLGGLQVAISLGSSQSNRHTIAHQRASVASNVLAGRDVTILASGATTKSDLNIQGSQIAAAERVALIAENALSLQGATQLQTTTSVNTSSGNSVGVVVDSRGGLGVNISGQRARGNSEGQDQHWRTAEVNSGQQVNVYSGTHTTIKGGSVTAPYVSVASAGSLNIESVQDSSTYTLHQKQVGASITLGTAPSGSVSYAKGDINSSYASVIAPSGIKAGDGGFDIKVTGDTVLKGGIISSTQAAVNAKRNQFATGGTLATTDIQNKAAYDGASVAIHLGTGFSPQGKLAPAGTGVGLGSNHAQTTGVTTAGISDLAGNTKLRTGDLHTGLVPIFDAEKVLKEINAQTRISQEFSWRANKIVGEYVESQHIALQNALKNAPSDEQKILLKQQLTDLRKTEHALNILIGAVTSVAGATVTKEALSAAAERMRDLMIEDSQKFAGVTDGRTTITNMSGDSTGVRHDGIKLGGTRMDLDALCGQDYYRCEANMIDGKVILKLNEFGQVKFNEKNAEISLSEFLNTKEGKELEGLTGGIQGTKGTLFGIPYVAGSWQDKLIESFAGTHDLIGGKITGLYDSEGNIAQGMSGRERFLHDRWADIAVIPSAPFALAEQLPPPVWQAISVLLKGSH